MAHFLVVEDDAFFRDALKSFLEGKKHKVTEAPNGKAARDILGAAKFDCIISDVQMPYLNGLELLQWVKSNCPTPFIMMTGFSHLVEAKTAHENGAEEFLPKPFKNEDLVAAISRILKEQAGGGEPDHGKNHANFCKVSIEEFVARPKIDFDVFVQLSERKFIKIGYAGASLPTEQIAKYKEKGLKHLHIKKEDFNKLVNFNLEVGKMIRKRTEIPKEKKMAFMKYTGEVILESAYVSGVNKESFKDASEFVSLTVEMLAEEGELFNLLDLLNSHSDATYSHSVGVGLYSVMLARLMGFETPTVFSKLSMAGLFHDIGEKEIDKEILDKPRHLLSQAERRLIETHPLRGRDILSEIPSISSDIVQLVYEHHEDQLGQGYPRAISKHALHPLSKILQLANIFVEQVLVSPSNPGKTPRQAIEYIETIYGERVDAKALEALSGLFNITEGPKS